MDNPALQEKNFMDNDNKKDVAAAAAAAAPKLEQPLMLTDAGLKVAAWEQSSVLVTVQVAVSGLRAADASKVCCSFTKRGVKLRIDNLNKNCYKFSIKNLAEEINIAESRHKVRKGIVLLMLSKAAKNKQWSVLNDAERDKLTQEETTTGNTVEKLMGLCSIDKSDERFSDLQTPVSSEKYQDRFVVEDESSALQALSAMKNHHIMLIFNIHEDKEVSRECWKLYKKVLLKHADDPLLGCTIINLKDYFFYSTDNGGDILTQTLLAKGIILSEFTGHLNAKDITKMGKHVKMLELAITNAAEAAAIASLPQLIHISVCVYRSVDCNDLKPLPDCISGVRSDGAAGLQLEFQGLSDSDIDWFTQCVDNLVGKRLFDLGLSDTLLTRAGLIRLSSGLQHNKINRLEIENRSFSKDCKMDVRIHFLMKNRCKVRWFVNKKHLNSSR